MTVALSVVFIVGTSLVEYEDCNFGGELVRGAPGISVVAVDGCALSPNAE